MTKKNLLPIIVLTVICLVVAVLLSVVNYFTADKIKDNNERKVQESLYAVFDGASGFDPIDLGGEELGAVVEAYTERSGLGWVIVLNTSTAYTSGQPMSISVGIDKDLKIVGVRLNAYSETRDVGSSYPQKFVGLTTDDIDLGDGNLLVSDVTFSSKAFKSAVKDALNFVTVLSGGEVEAPEAPEETLPKTDAELIALSQSLLEGSGEFEDVTPEDAAEAVKRVLEDKNGNGYTAYINTYFYGELANELLVAFDNGKNIVGINNLTWHVGHDADSTPPAPSSEAVDAFFESFVGKSADDIASVELVTNATGTAQLARDAIVAAANALPDGGRSLAELIALSQELLEGSGELEDITPEDAPEAVVRVLKDKNGKGYVAYINTYYYGELANELLVAFDNGKNIVGINNLTWHVGHDADSTPPAPSSEAVDAFFESFVGKDADDIASVELVTNATGTAQLARDAIVAAADALPTEAFPTARVVGIAIAAVAVIATAAATVICKKGRRIK